MNELLYLGFYSLERIFCTCIAGPIAISRAVDRQRRQSGLLLLQYKAEFTRRVRDHTDIHHVDALWLDI